MTIEICTADIDSVGAAIKGGARRIELCTVLEAGGMTPSAALMSRAIWKCSRLMDPVKVHVLVRPRTGDFFYTDRELEVAAEDAAYAVEAGADGIVFGALTPDGDIDDFACAKIGEAIARAAKPDKPISMTFHRAFDFCRNPIEAMHKIAAMGFNRILTSGQAPTAWEGRELIARLVKEAPNGLTVMAGAGVTVGNLQALTEATGITEAHASAKKLVESRMKFRIGDVNTGAAGNSDYVRYQTDATLVRELIENFQTES